MLKSLLLGTCIAVTLSGCFINTKTGSEQSTKTVNSALTGACLAAQLYPCTPQPSTRAEKDQAQEAQAAAVRDKAQRDSVAASQDAARRSSCETDVGPRLPVSQSQCAHYGDTLPVSQPAVSQQANISPN